MSLLLSVFVCFVCACFFHFLAQTAKKNPGHRLFVYCVWYVLMSFCDLCCLRKWLSDLTGLLCSRLSLNSIRFWVRVDLMNSCCSSRFKRLFCSGYYEVDFVDSVLCMVTRVLLMNIRIVFLFSDYTVCCQHDYVVICFPSQPPLSLTRGHKNVHVSANSWVIWSPQNYQKRVWKVSIAVPFN